MYVVIGAGGFLGSYMLKSILIKTNEHIVAVSRSGKGSLTDKRIKWTSCDITSKSDVDRLADSLQDEILNVIYLAAYHHPDKVEENPKLAWHINVTSLSYLMNRLKNVERFFYPSSDSVYGQSKDGHHYKETDILNPMNTYGKQKIVAEQLVTGYGYNVVRYPFLIGRSLAYQKRHFYDELVDMLRSGKEIQMFSDSYRSSLSFADAANYLIDIMQVEGVVPPIINICGDLDLSKYDIGLMIAEFIGVDSKLVKAISIDGSSKIFKAKRAASTLMDNSLFKMITGRDNVVFSVENCEVEK